jgi:transmembrane sensor
MIRPRASLPLADPCEAAARWSARRRLGLISARDEEAFALWLEDPANRVAWEATEGPLEAIGAFAAQPEIRALRERALAARPARSRTVWRWAGGGAIAASLALGIALVAWDAPAPPTPDAPATRGASSVERYTTGIGERRTVRLADGSRIELNTGSLVEVAYSPAGRDVRLIGGQALFRVARDSSRPFAVLAGDRRIVATGTEFDVRLGERGAVTVTLIEGHVRVEPLRREPAGRSTASGASETLDAGETLAVAPNGSVRIATADVERQTSWTRGQIIFRDDRMAEAVAEVNRYSTNRLIVTDPRVANLRVSGAFAAGSTGNFVAAVTAFFPVDARREGGVTVLEWRESGG